MATSAQIEDWPGKTGVKMVTLSSPSIKVMKKITVTSLAKKTWKHNSRSVYFPLEQPFTQWSTLEKVRRKTETWSWVLTRQVAVEISYFTHCQLVDNITPTADASHTHKCNKLQNFQASGYDGKENPFFWGTTGRMTNRWKEIWSIVSGDSVGNLTCQFAKPWFWT